MNQRVSTRASNKVAMIGPGGLRLVDMATLGPEAKLLAFVQPIRSETSRRRRFRLSAQGCLVDHICCLDWLTQAKAAEMAEILAPLEFDPELRAWAANEIADEASRIVGSC